MAQALVLGPGDDAHTAGPQTKTASRSKEAMDSQSRHHSPCRKLLAALILAGALGTGCRSTSEAHLEVCREPLAQATVRRHDDRSYREILCAAETSRLRLEAPLNAHLEQGTIRGLQAGQFVTLREDRPGRTLEASYREVQPGAFDWVYYEDDASGPATPVQRAWIEGSLRHLQAHQLLVERAVDDLLSLIQAGPKAYAEAFRRVATLGFTQDRIRVLAALAERPDLPAELQVDIIHYVINEIAYSNDQMLVLSKLLDNPAFSSEARRTILENIELFGFSVDRRRLRRALDPGSVPVEPVDGL